MEVVVGVRGDTRDDSGRSGQGRSRRPNLTEPKRHDYVGELAWSRTAPKQVDPGLAQHKSSSYSVLLSCGLWSALWSRVVLKQTDPGLVQHLVLLCSSELWSMVCLVV